MIYDITSLQETSEETQLTRVLKCVIVHFGMHDYNVIRDIN